MYISIGSSPTINIIYGLPSDVYQLGRLRQLIFFFSMDYPPIIFSFRQPSETIFSRPTSCIHSYHPRVLPVHMECMMPIPFQFNDTCNNLNHTNMSCNFTINHIKISSRGLMIKHEQFDLNYSTKHIISQKLFCEHYSWE